MRRNIEDLQVKITQHRRQFRISFPTELFDLSRARAIVDIRGDSISIKRPDMEYMGKSFKATVVGNYTYVVQVTDQLDTGIYNIDFEDSNEDELIIDLTPINNAA